MTTQDPELNYLKASRLESSYCLDDRFFLSECRTPHSFPPLFFATKVEKTGILSDGVLQRTGEHFGALGHRQDQL